MMDRTLVLAGLFCVATGCAGAEDRGAPQEGETDNATSSPPLDSDPGTDPTTPPDEDDDGGTSSDPGDETGESGGEESSGSGVELRRLALEVQGLETLLGGFHYEGWAIIDGAPVSFGKFNVDASGVATDLEGIAVPDSVFDAGRDLTVATDFVITIEVDGDVDITPGVTHILAGPLDGEEADLTVGEELAIGTNFGDAAGVFILATPTDGPDTNETAGLWFFDLSVAPPVPGLSLPELADGWVYEGWAVVDGVPLTTGRFEVADVEDFAAPFSGEEAGPPVPGEDFLVDPPDGVDFPANLQGATAVITVEPEPDFSDAPFSIKPLLAEIPEQAADHQVFALDRDTSSLPTGTVTLIE